MKRVDYFNWVRDIPYNIPLTPEEPDHCCLGKHQILEKLLKGAGLEVRPRICESDWDSLSIPKEILKIPHQSEVYHVYLEVKLRGKWCQIDASLDKGLSKSFPLIEWDGNTSTNLCITPKGKIFSPKESFEIYHDNTDNTPASEIKFYSALNSWFREIRVGAQFKQ